MNAFAEHVKRFNNSDFAPTPTWNDAVEIVENLPSVDAVEIVTEYCRKRNLVIISRESFRVLQEERKLGNWVRNDDGFYECNVCGFTLDDWIEGVFYSFCPNCGADMRGGQDGLN